MKFDGVPVGVKPAEHFTVSELVLDIRPVLILLENYMHISKYKIYFSASTITIRV